jgi:ABC-2 type transport system ATP-binding protein
MTITGVQPAATLTHVTRRFGATTALDDVTVAFPGNTISGLLGRNGAGKTTLMSILAGHDRPRSGTVTVFGRDPFENPDRTTCFIRDNQRYPDDYRLHHILAVLPAFHPNWDADLAGRVADGLRIPPKTQLRKLSRGQQSAVSIVIGLAAHAPLTIFDEPYLGLDATARRIFYDLLIEDFVAHPRTVLISTHLIDEMEPLLERVVILDEGRVVLDADLDDARTRAVTVTGGEAAVSAATVGRRVLATHALGGLRSVTVETAPGDEPLAGRDGIELAPVGLQDLVAAYGTTRELQGASR